MNDDLKPYLPTWAIVVVALLVPVVLAIGFLMALDWSNRMDTVEEWRSDPHMGEKVADRNLGILLMYAMTQLAFLIVGAWWVKVCGKSRALFLLIGMPVSGFVFFATLIGPIAK